MKKTVLALLLALLAPVLARAAGTVVLTTTDSVMGQSVKIYTYTLTADAAAATFPATASMPIDGWIIKVKTSPGSTAPTALWDLTLVGDGMDVMGGYLTNRSATATEHILFPQPYVRGPVTITATGNAVNSAVVVLDITVLR
jgi:hypothetical protein